MRLSKLVIKNYRNFIDEEVNINSKSLIIGPNDVGKTNLLNCIRIIFDKSLSYLDMEPDDKDFNIFLDQSEITIIAELSEINETDDTYIRAALGKYIANDSLYIMYKGYKNSEEKFKFFISGINEPAMYNEINGRNIYINLINCVYLDSTRQLKQFLKKSKSKMIESYKNNRLSEQIDSDLLLINAINEEVNALNENIEKISYIENSADFIKEELTEMSSHNDNLNIKLSSYNDADEITNNVDLIAEIEGKRITIGGDGRSNQIYISMWIKEMNEKFDGTKQFVIFLLEEPESHLHFSLQSMTMRNILSRIQTQCIITTHSPQVLLEFNPFSIIRLYFDNSKKVCIANNGCCEELNDEMLNFSYRYNLITGSMFFSSAVFLVEGKSEQLLYNYLTKKININLEKYNVMIISVEGVGFEPYIRLLNRLNIPFAIRTDNDVIKNNLNNKYYYSGVLRLIKYYNIIEVDQFETKTFEKREQKDFNKEDKKIFDELLNEFSKRGLFLSKYDLENDLSKCDFLNKYIKENFEDDKLKFVEYLKSSKASNMFALINNLNGLKFEKKDINDILQPIDYLLGILNEKN